MNEDITIQELCDQTGFPRRTIHFYIQQGILPPPLGSGLGARYQSEHLLRLKLIPVFRKQGLRLDEIRQKFEASSGSELAETFAQYQSPVPEPRAVIPVPLPMPGIAQTYTAYTLPRGMILMVPENAAGNWKIMVQKIFQAVQKDSN